MSWGLKMKKRRKQPDRPEAAKPIVEKPKPAPAPAKVFEGCDCWPSVKENGLCPHR